MTRNHKKISISLRPESIFLDAKNPRLIIEMAKDNYTDIEIVKKTTQDDIFKIIQKPEHEVDDLMESIRKNNFNPHIGNPIIVRKVKEKSVDDKYILIEGNRRITSIKLLLKEKNLPNELMQSISKIQCYELIYTGNDYKYEYPKIINESLLANLDKPKQWGAMHEARQFHQMYLLEVNKPRGVQEHLIKGEIDKEIIKTVASEGAGFTEKFVLQRIKIYNVFLQLKKHKYEVTIHHYTLLDLALSGTISTDYFGFNESSTAFNETGMEKFDTLCIHDKRPIHNPQLFKKFVNIFRKAPELVSQIENHSSSIPEIDEIVKLRNVETKTKKKLEDILKRINNLNIQALGNKTEKALLKKIINAIDKFMPFIDADDLDLSEKSPSEIRPKDAQAALDQSSPYKQELIKRTLKANGEKIKSDDLIIRVIKYSGIKILREKRVMYEKQLLKEIKKMKNDRIIEENKEKYRKWDDEATMIFKLLE